MAPNTKHILAIIGSASRNSSNEKIVHYLSSLLPPSISLSIYPDLKLLPHFEPEQSIHQTPESIIHLRRAIEQADGVVICTPEYVFSIPSGLKNAIEWCVSTTVFSNRPTGLITASAQGEKGHEELKLLMQTLMADVSEDTQLLIQGVKGKVNEAGEITDAQTRDALKKLMEAFIQKVTSIN